MVSRLCLRASDGSTCGEAGRPLTSEGSTCGEAGSSNNPAARRNEELLEMIDEADRDDDGEVNEEEFLRIMKRTNLF